MFELAARRALALGAAALVAGGAAASPLACQPLETQPMLPIFHIIGNVTPGAGNNVTVEPINDASGITFYRGLWHVWHQCCQDHWDHCVSRDLIHWQRLPPPIQPLTTKTWDGSISLLDAAAGGPVILYDAQDGKAGIGGRDSPILGVARLVDPDDAYLLTWARRADNPVNFTGPPVAFPGQVWRNGDHFNFNGQGARFTTRDATFHSWTNAGPFNGESEHSGGWTFPVPNSASGAPPPPGSPNLAVNVGGGATFQLGTYDAAAESFAPWRPSGEPAGRVASLEGGAADWWGAQGGPDVGGRAMMVGWALPDFTGDAGPGITFLTRLTLVREVTWDAELATLVSNPLPELAGLRADYIARERGLALAPGGAPTVVPGTPGGAAASADVVVTFSGVAPGAVFGACVLVDGAGAGGLGALVSVSSGGGSPGDYYEPGEDRPGGDYNVTDVSYSDPRVCQAACTADPACAAYTYVTRPPLVGSCCLKGSVPAQNPNPTCTSGIKPAPPGSFDVRVGSCAEAAAGALRGPPVGTLRLRGGSAAPTLTLRVLADRSVADFFAEGGRWAGTVSWPTSHAPRNPGDSAVLAWATTPGVVADIDVAAMGCGWVTPSYTDSPTM